MTHDRLYLEKTPKSADGEIQPVTSPVTFTTIREGKYLRPETNRDGPVLARNFQEIAD